jgi:MFS family permease
MKKPSGFDNGVTGGVISHKGFATRFFPDTLTLPESSSNWCIFDNHLLQLFTSCLFLAGAAAAMGGSWTSRRYGRKFTMTLAGACFLAGTVIVAAAVHIAMLIVGRLILGLGVGFATQATPLYLSEMAPFNLRGALNIMFQLAVTIGILAAQLINYGTQYLQPWGWRLSLAMGAVPAVVVLVGSLLLPETPNSLVQRGRFEEGRKVLQRIRGVDDVDMEYSDIVDAAEEAAKMKSAMRVIVGRGYRPQLAICILIPIFQQCELFFQGQGGGPGGEERGRRASAAARLTSEKTKTTAPFSPSKPPNELQSPASTPSCSTPPSSSSPWATRETPPSWPPSSSAPSTSSAPSSRSSWSTARAARRCLSRAGRR